MTRTILLSGVLLLLAASAWMQVQAGNAGDKDWLLLAAKMWLGGKTLYVDIFELDPPLIVWLYAVPEWVAAHTRLADFQALGLMGLGACLLSVWLCACLIRMHPLFADDRDRQTGFALLLACVFVFFNTQVYFFDREHVFFVLTFPYMLRFMPSLAHRPMQLRLRLGIALLAALGFCIKPYTLIVFAALQLLYIVRERSCAILWSFENCIIYAGGALYFLCVWLFAPDYIWVVMPMAFVTYSGFSRKINGYLFLSIAFVSAGLNFVEFRPRYVTPYRRDTYYFMGVCLAFLTYALANNGWGYTYNLLLCMLIFMSSWMLWEYSWLKRDHEAQGLPTRQFAFGMRGCAANLILNAAYMLLCLWTFFFTASCEKYVECRQNNPYIVYARQQHIHSFGALSMNLRKWTSFANASGAVWDTRFHALWMLPKLLQEGDAFTARHYDIVQYVARGFAEDLNSRKAEVVFVDRSDGIFGYPHPVDLLAFFSHVSEFREAWKHYRYDSTIDQCREPDEKETAQLKIQVRMDCRYDIYRRKE